MASTAILLAAGYATRLYPLTQDRSKALLPLGGRVILDAVWDALGTVPDLTRRILVTNARFAEPFRAWAKLRGAKLAIVDDGTSSNETRLGAMRDLELARTQGGAVGDLLVVGTDNLFTWSLGDFVAQARRHHPAPSVAIGEASSKEAARQLGVVLLDETGRIAQLLEKPADPPSTKVALCVYYFPEPMLGRLTQFLQEGGRSDAPGYFIEWLVRREPAYGVPMRGTWFDIGTTEAYDAVVKTWPALAAGLNEPPGAPVGETRRQSLGHKE